MATGAQIIVSELERAGVAVCFGLPGVHNLALWEALRESSIRLVGVRHEQAAAYAADGYARATGRLGVALTTTGPGAANTLGAVGEAWASRSPILVIATDIPSALRRPGEYRGVLHETDGQSAMFAPVVKSVHLGLAPDAVAPRPRAAVRDAVGRPDPPGLPGDRHRPARRRGARAGALGARRCSSRARPRRRRSRCSTRAERPLLWVGGGARDAADGVARARRAARRAGAHHLRRGRRAAARATRAWSAPAARRGRRPPVGRGRRRARDRLRPRRRPDPELRPAPAGHADRDRRSSARPTTASTRSSRPTPRSSRALAEVREPRRRRPDLASRRAPRPARRSTRPPCASSTRSASPSPPTACSSSTCASRATGSRASTRPPRRAACRCRSAGARSATRSRRRSARRCGAGPAVSISGDGGFLFACGELATMAQEQIPLTAVIVDDGGYGMLRYDQVLAGSETFGVDLHTPDFEALAALVRRAGGDGRRARRRVRRGAGAARRVGRAVGAGRAHPDAAGAAAEYVAELVPPAAVAGCQDRFAAASVGPSELTSAARCALGQ